MSKAAYVEVLNSLHQPVLQAQLALREATGQGSLCRTRYPPGAMWCKPIGLFIFVHTFDQVGY